MRLSVACTVAGPEYPVVHRTRAGYILLHFVCWHGVCVSSQRKPLAVVTQNTAAFSFFRVSCTETLQSTCCVGTLLIPVCAIAENRSAYQLLGCWEGVHHASNGPCDGFPGCAASVSPVVSHFVVGGLPRNEWLVEKPQEPEERQRSGLCASWWAQFIPSSFRTEFVVCSSCSSGIHLERGL